MITILFLKTFELFLLSKASWCVRQSAILVLSWNWPRSCWNANSFWQKPCKSTLDNYLWNSPKDRLQPWQILYAYRKTQRRWLLLVWCQLQGYTRTTRDRFSQVHFDIQIPTHSQEETCFENVLVGFIPKTWHLSLRTVSDPWLSFSRFWSCSFLAFIKFQWKKQSFCKHVQSETGWPYLTIKNAMWEMNYNM